MRKALKMGICSILLVAALFSFSAFTSASSTHAEATVHARSLQPAATTCYGQAIYIGPYTIAADATDFYLLYPYTTTSYCNDINVKVTQQAGPTQIRVIFLDKTTHEVKGYGSWKTISSTNTWYVVASDVLDGTLFILECKDPYVGSKFAFYGAW